MNLSLWDYLERSFANCSLMKKLNQKQNKLVILALNNRLYEKLFSLKSIRKFIAIDIIGSRGFVKNL